MNFFYSEERDQYIRQIKQAVVNHEEVNIPEEYRCLAGEWQRSVEKGVSLKTTYLSESTRDMHVFERIDGFDRYRLSYLNDYYKTRDEVLEELGCAIFYTYDELSVYRKAGDQELLAELRECGLRTGSNLSEENVGVFVANIAKQYPDQVICRVGEENYIELFSKYACFSHYWHEERRNTGGILLVITPTSNCSERVRKIVEFLLKTEDISHEINYTFSKKRNDFLETVAYNNEAMELYLDEHGGVVFASKEFEEQFGRKVVPGPLAGIDQFMPELSYLTRYFDETRNPCQTKEVMLLTKNKKNSFFWVSPTILHTYNGEKGMRCVIEASVKKKKTVVSNTGAELRYSFDSIIGQSASMIELKSYAREAAASGSNVLLLGESGTGKELFAQSIHSASNVKSGPFVPINCAALSKELLNSELFGYEEGAFTGASKGGAPGKFEQADGGTIFLDEIGDMPLEMQSALLRVLEDKTVVRIGGKKYIPVNVRVIAATNQDLWKNVQKGTFRADLYFRLNIIAIKIPPLRERKDDIPLLVDAMAEQIREKNGSGGQLSPELIDLFKNYSWPGNVRELRNTVERCLHYARSGLLTPEDLPEELSNMLLDTKPAQKEQSTAESIRNVNHWRGYDKARVIELMQQYGGNKSKVAQELGISRATFYKRLKEFGLD